MKPWFEPRTRGLLALLIADPWRKLASLALAIAVWLWLSARTDERWTVQLGLSLESAVGQQAPQDQISLSVRRDQFLVTGFTEPGQDPKPVQRVLVTVFGPKLAVELVRKRGIGFVVDPVDHERASGRVDITASRLTLDYMETGKLTFELSPPLIVAHLSHVAQKLINLGTALVHPQLPAREDQRARVQWQDAEFSPGQVTLVGPRSAIDDLPQGELFRVDLAKDDLDTLAADVTVLSARLQLLPELAEKRLRIQETAAEVKVPLSRRSRVFDLELVPELDFPAGTSPDERAAWRLRDKERPVKVQLKSFSPALSEILSGAAVDDWKRRNCRLKANFAAFDKATGRTPTVFYIYSEGLQEFQAGQERDYVVVPPPVYVEQVKR